MFGTNFTIYITLLRLILIRVKPKEKTLFKLEETVKHQSDFISSTES